MAGHRAAVCAVRKITSGDDLSITVTLYEGGVVYDASGKTVYAAFTDGRGRQIIGQTIQSAGTTGAAWGTGVIVCVFTAQQALALDRNSYFLEIQVVAGGLKSTWPLIPLEVQVGVIY